MSLACPLGVLLVVIDEDGIRPVPWLHKILGVVINLLRSVPFLILLFIVLPLSKLIIGTRIGSPAMIVPLTIAAAPYIARVVESSLREIGRRRYRGGQVHGGFQLADHLESAAAGVPPVPAGGARRWQ